MAHIRGKTLLVQRQFTRLGIPRMYRSSGTEVPNVFDDINDMLTKLAASPNIGAHEMLRQLNRGERSFVEVLSVFQSDGINGVAALSDKKDYPIDAASFDEWLQGHTNAKTTRVSYTNNYKSAMRFAKKSDTMDNIPNILNRYRADCVKNDRHYRAFDLARVVMQAWVRSMMGRRSPTYISIQEDVKRFGKVVTTRRLHRSYTYFSPRDVRNVMARLPDDVAAMVWTQAMHGFRMKEYLVDGFEVVGNALVIKGVKTGHSHRPVPLVCEPAPVVIPDQRLYAYLVKKASMGKMTTHDLRRCYRRWMESAGFTRTTIEQYMGHAPSNVDDLYAQHSRQSFFEDDANRFRAWVDRKLAEEPAPDIAPEKIRVVRRGIFLKKADFMVKYVGTARVSKEAMRVGQRGD